MIFLDVPAVPLCNSRARKIAAKHDNLWNEIVFNAVVKDLLKTSQRVRLVQPNVRKEKKVHIREIALDSEGILSLQFFFGGVGVACVSGEGYEAVTEHLRPPEVLSLLYLESRRAQISSLRSYYSSLSQKIASHVSPRGFSAFTGRMSDRDHAECRVLRVIALHERK